MRICTVSTAIALTIALASGSAAVAQPANQAAAAQILQADRDFAKSVADRNKDRFLSFLAEATTFNGGTRNEIKGRDAVWKDWSDFFDPNGPTLEWSPTRAEVIGNGEVGYSVGRSILRQKSADGKIAERRGEYLTVWRKQTDGAWKVVFDTGSSLP